MSTRSHSIDTLDSRISLHDNINIGVRIQNGLFTRIITESSIYETLDMDLEPFLKRSFDILLSGIGLLLSSWLWAAIAILVILEDGFPVIIRQYRIGRGGRIFFSYKFRSMVKSSLMEKVNSQAAEHDHRVTKIGKWLRASALDELPQLWNILADDMSFVGPRPLLPNEIEINGAFGDIRLQDIPAYEKRISVYPGLTGTAQIFAPRDIPRKHKFKYDLLYIRKMSFFYDIQLITLSFLITFKGAWEKRCAKLRIFERCNR